MDYDYEDQGSYDVSVLCSSCLCELHTDAERQEHYASEWHIYNVKRKTAELPPIPYQLFHEKFTLVQKMKEEEQKRNGKIICPITNREFKSQAAYDHFRGTKEYARQYERFVKKQQALQQQALQQQDGNNDEETTGRKFVSKHHIEYVVPPAEEDQPTAQDLALIEQDKLDEAAEAEDNVMKTTTTTTTTTETMNDEDDATVQEGQNAIPLKYSLFDNYGPFSCTRTAYTYMVRKYNFKIPYMEFLIDFEGLLEYLGAKIGIGHVCLNCNKRFPTTIGCQQHMITQNHTAFTLEALQKGAEFEGEDFIFNFYVFLSQLC
eukprot:UN00464